MSYKSLVKIADALNCLQCSLILLTGEEAITKISYSIYDNLFY